MTEAIKVWNAVEGATKAVYSLNWARDLNPKRD